MCAALSLICDLWRCRSEPMAMVEMFRRTMLAWKGLVGLVIEFTKQVVTHQYCWFEHESKRVHPSC
jgi:hypothetical protein